MQKKVDVIVIVAVDSNGLSSVVNEARQEMELKLLPMTDLFMMLILIFISRF